MATKHAEFWFVFNAVTEEFLSLDSGNPKAGVIDTFYSMSEVLEYIESKWNQGEVFHVHFLEDISEEEQT